MGMTLAPETFLARELEMCYAPVCYLTNYAEGVVDREFKTGQLFEGMQTDQEKSAVENSVLQFPALLAASLVLLKDRDRVCHCKEALQRYRNKGMISGDWRTWVSSP